MTLLARLRSFVSALAGRRRLEHEMDEEWRFHVDARMEALVAGGLSREEAARQARREFGDPVRLKEEAREARGLCLLQEMVADLRYAARSLRQAPAFTATAIVTLTLGVGLNTGVFSVLNGTLLRPWPLPDPDQVVLVFKGARSGAWMNGVSPAEFRFLREQATGVDLAGIAQAVESLRIRHGDIDESFPARIVSGNYFDALRVPVTRGRGLRPGDDDAAAPVEVAVIGHGLWRDVFGEATDVIGRTLQVNDVPFEIVGVAAPGATDSPMTRAPAVWVPLATYPRIMRDTEFNRGFLTNPGYCCVNLAGRLRDTGSRTSAAAELDLAVSRFSGDDNRWRVRLTGTAVAHQPWDPQVAPALALVVAWVLAVLLVACANLGNLQLARAMARRRELAVRAVLGAGRARLVRQLLTEGLLIAAVGSLTAFTAAYLVVRTMVRLAPPGPVDDLASLVSPDLRVFGVGCVLATVAMLIAGIGPALAGTRRLVVTGPASGERRVRLRAAFLAVQVALSVVLLVGAALLARGVARATTLVPTAVQDVVRVQVVVPEQDTDDRPSGTGGLVFGDGMRADTTGWQRLHEDLQARFGSSPVHRVAASSASIMSTTVRADPDGAGRRVWVRRVSPEFFPMLGIPLVAGELFGTTSHPADVVVNESLARLLWPGAPVLGRVLHADEPRRVVGVVSDAHWIDSTEPGPTLFVRGFGMLIVRNEPAVLEAVRAAVADLVPDARAFFPLVRPGSIAGYVVLSSLAGALGVIALGMATAGTFGVLMYLFAQRSREIAVRMALGARAGHVAGLLTGEALGALAIGAAAGLALSFAAANLLRAYLLGLGPYDPLAYLAAVALLAMAIAAASIAPIRRALAIDPAITLRQE